MFVNLDDGALRMTRGRYGTVSDWIPSLLEA
jgi:hypothetical protein